MVNTDNIKPPKGDNLSDEERCIHGGPLFDLSVVQGVAQKGKIYLVTKKCFDDVEKLGWSTEVEVRELVLQLSKSNYHRSAWCQISLKKNLVACDAYKIKRYESYGSSGSKYLCEYYVKLAIGPLGDALLIVSCHPSESS